MELQPNFGSSVIMLLVSSDSNLCETIKTILKTRLIEVQVVKDIRQAMELFDAEPDRFSCVLCDIDDNFIAQHDTYHHHKFHKNVPLLAILHENKLDPLLKEILVDASSLVFKNNLAEQLEISLDILLSRVTKYIEYQVAYEFSLNGICSHKMLYDINGNPFDCQYLHVNNAYESVTGLKREMIIGHTIRDIFPADAAQGIIDEYSSMLMENRTINQEVFFEPLDNWFSISVSEAQNDIFTVFVENITERKNAQVALAHMEDHFRSIVDSGVALIWTAGLDKQCDYFNRPWLEFTGKTLESQKGYGWTEGVHPDDLERCVEIYEKAFEAREKFNMEYRLKGASGEYSWIQDIGTPRYDTKGFFMGYVGHCTDVDSRKKAEQALKEKMSDLERFSRITVDRELHMIELKKEVNRLLEKCKLQHKYIIHE